MRVDALPDFDFASSTPEGRSKRTPVRCGCRSRISDARGLELEPNFSSRLLHQVGIAPQIADRLAEGARILGLPE
jgi:hypothetical protein